MLGAAIHLRYNDSFNTVFYFTNLRLAFTTFGITDFIIIDETQYRMGSYFKAMEFNVHTFEKLEECEEHFKNEAEFVYLEPVYVNTQNNVSLHEFEHPESAIYVVGADTTSIPTKGRENKKWIHVPTFGHEDGLSMYAETAILFPLYDRSVKTWR